MKKLLITTLIAFSTTNLYSGYAAQVPLSEAQMLQQANAAVGHLQLPDTVRSLIGRALKLSLDMQTAEAVLAYEALGNKTEAYYTAHPKATKADIDALRKQFIANNPTLSNLERYTNELTADATPWIQAFIQAFLGNTESLSATEIKILQNSF